MKLYHATEEELADAILRDGFNCDAWFADVPTEYGIATLCVEVPDAVAEIHKLLYADQPNGFCPGGDYYEYVFPPEVINRYQFELVDELA